MNTPKVYELKDLFLKDTLNNKWICQLKVAFILKYNLKIKKKKISYFILNFG